MNQLSWREKKLTWLPSYFLVVSENPVRILRRKIVSRTESIVTNTALASQKQKKLKKNFFLFRLGIFIKKNNKRLIFPTYDDDDDTTHFLVTGIYFS